MTPHIEAAKGDYAQTVLLPGDPLRAQWIAETYFENNRCVNKVRNCLGFSGTYRGLPVSVQATGMGQPSTAIYLHELLNVYGAKNLIRVGTCGGLSEKVKLRDIIIAMTASTDSAINRHYFGPHDFAPHADFGLLHKAFHLAESNNLKHHVGALVSGDVFYQEDGLAYFDKLRNHNVLGVEMETSTLYTLAARFGARALSICTMSDCLVTGDQIDASQRQASLHHMVKLALDTVVKANEA